MLRTLGIGVTAVVMSAGLAVTPALSKTIMNIGYSVNESHPYGTFMNTFADRFEKLTGGKV